MITKIWYSIRNGDDGSAFPVLMESKELAELDQEHSLYGDENDWAEDCSGSITIEHNSPIIIRDSVATVESELKEINENYNGPEDKYFPTKRYEALNKLKGN